MCHVGARSTTSHGMKLDKATSSLNDVSFLPQSFSFPTLDGTTISSFFLPHWPLKLREKSDGCKQQDHSNCEFLGSPLLHSYNRRRNLAGFQARQRMHPFFPVAGGSPRRFNPPRLLSRIHWCLLEQTRVISLLPLLYGSSNRPLARPSRLHLRRHSPQRQLLRHGPRIQRVPARRILVLAQESSH